jgi:hypothetical protein
MVKPSSISSSFIKKEATKLANKWAATDKDYQDSLKLDSKGDEVAKEIVGLYRKITTIFKVIAARDQ